MNAPRAFVQILLGLASKPHESVRSYQAMCFVYGAMMWFALGLSIWHLSSGV